jgi:hypothetical protein
MQETAHKPLLRRLLRVATWALVGLWATWCVGALWYAPWPWWARLLLARGYAVVLAAPRLPHRLVSTAGASLALTVAWCSLVRPSIDRPDWSPDQVRLPQVIDAPSNPDIVSVWNVRDCDYRSTTDYDVRWENRDYDLRRLDTVWFVVEPFSVGSAAAHSLLSFGFDDGTYVAVSVEIRKQRGEHFSPFAGM